MRQIKYTYGAVVATLTTIETPTATAFKVDAPEADEADALLDQKPSEKEPELFLVKTKPITSSIRATVKHLRAEAGPWSRFRGLGIAIFYHLFYAFFYNLCVSTFSTPFKRAFFAILFHTLLARIHMTWTHVVISNPSTKKWYQRIPNRKTNLKVLGPTALWATAEQLALYVPAALFYIYGLNRYAEDPTHYRNVDSNVRASDMTQLFICGLVGLFIVFAVVFPAEVTLTRVQASLLPEEDDTIVPFDRTFGGKVVPAVTGGSGCVSMLDAWKTFDWAARIRLVKLYVKIFVVQFATTLLFIGMIIGELRLIMGDDLHKAVKMAHESLR